MTKVGVPSYWSTHYTFEKSSQKRDKKITSSFVNLLKINTLIPLAFYYQKAKGNDSTRFIFDLMHEIKPEKNAIVAGFQALGIEVSNALDTQSLLKLRKAYCELKKVFNLQCGSIPFKSSHHKLWQGILDIGLKNMVLQFQRGWQSGWG